MDQEDGLIWVYGPSDDGVMAFTDFGIETLVELIESHKPIRNASSVRAIPSSRPRPTPNAYP